MNVGLDKDTGLLYEAQSTRGHPLWPAPLVFQTVVTSDTDEVFNAARHGDLAPNSFLFREDTYNSSSRIRKGRLYQAQGSPNQDWICYPHPALNEDKKADMNGGTLTKWLIVFKSFRLWPYLKRENIEKPIFLIGSEGGFTIWTLVNIETTATGDELIIIRARKSIGALPNLKKDLILKVDGKDAIDYIEKLEEDLYKAGPESVIDRAREATTSILSKYFQSKDIKVNGKDLAKLANIAADEKLEIVANSAKTIARLHARGKHSEQEKRAPRKITEQDAETSVQLVGLILCDLGWGEW